MKYILAPVQTQHPSKLYVLTGNHRAYSRGEKQEVMKCLSDRKIAVNEIRSPIECQIQCVNYADNQSTCSCFKFWQSSRRCVLYRQTSSKGSPEV